MKYYGNELNGNLKKRKTDLLPLNMPEISITTTTIKLKKTEIVFKTVVRFSTITNGPAIKVKIVSHFTFLFKN